MERSEIERMQRDAEKRMREMKARSDQIIKGEDMPPIPDFVSAGAGSKRKTDKSTETDKPDQNDTSTVRRGFDLLKILNFNKFKIDNDALLIIALIFLLSTDDCDELLLLALMYIMI